MQYLIFGMVALIIANGIDKLIEKRNAKQIELLEEIRDKNYNYIEEEI